MDIVNWLYLKNAELIRDNIDNPEDLVLLGADVSFDKRGDKYLTYAVPVSLLTGGGGGGGITDADNGLHLGIPTTAYLGGTLLETTTIDVTDLYQLNIIGTNNQPKGAVVYIENSSVDGGNISLNVSSDVGLAINCLTIEGTALSATSTGTGEGVTASSVLGTGLIAVSSNNNPASDARPIYAYGNAGTPASLFQVASYIQGNPDSLITPGIIFKNATAGTSAIGMGISINFEIKNKQLLPVNDTTLLTSRIASRFTDITVGAESSSLNFYALEAGTEQSVVVMHGNGIFQLAQGLDNYADDAAAAAGGIPVNGLYRNGSVVQIRVV